MTSSDHPAPRPDTPRSMIRRLGLLGGSFNPIHYGHVTIARLTREQLPLDQVLFIPTGDPPHKDESALAPAEHRVTMVRLAIADDPTLDCSDIEVHRPGKSYSIDTVRTLHTHYGPSVELHFLIGLDAFLDLQTWRRPQALLAACRFVVLSRPGHSFRSLKTLALLPPLDLNALAQLDSGERTRLDIALPSGPALTCLGLPPCSISASDIRQRVRTGTPLANLLPPQVESYILQHRLYQEDRNHTHI